MSTNLEVGKTVLANGILTNYHDEGDGPPVLLIHGSGPGVTAWANWRLTIPTLAARFRVIAPDIVGFGYTERPAGIAYDMASWMEHALGVLDALGIQKAHLVGNSFGGALALALAIHAPDRTDRLVLMGSAGTKFPITSGLERVWGYSPSPASMEELLGLFTYDSGMISEELVQMRYQASVRPGYQESFSHMFPEPRQRSLDALASQEESIKALLNATLIVHGREDKIIPLASSYRLFELVSHAQLHVFGHCGHWTQIEHSERFNRLVSEFLSESTA